MIYTEAQTPPQPMVTDMGRSKTNPKKIGAAAGRALLENPVRPPKGLDKIHRQWWDISSQPVDPAVHAAIRRAILNAAAGKANDPS